MTAIFTTDSQKCGEFIYHNKIITDIHIDNNNYNFIKNIFDTIRNYNIDFSNQYTKTSTYIQKLTNSPIIYFLYKELVIQNKLINFLKNTDISIQDIDKLHNSIINNDIEYFKNWYTINIKKLPSIIDYKYFDTKIKKILTDKNREYLNNIMYNNIFMSINVQTYVEINDIIQTKYTFNNLVINIFSIKTEQININNILHICQFMFALGNIKDPQLTLNIISTDIKKNFPSIKNNHITSENVNTGSRCDNTITIWRNEEIYKVLIHELIHYLGFDSSILFDKNICNNFNIDGNILISEGYTEAIALIIHSIYVMSKLYKSFNNEIFKKIILYEINFSLYQCKKILNHFDITSIDNFLIKKKQTIKQTTDVFSYFFIKTILILSLNKLLSFIKLDYKIGNRINEFGTMITDKNKWNHFMELINKLKNINDEFIKNTLRMSCLQLN